MKTIGPIWHLKTIASRGDLVIASPTDDDSERSIESSQVALESFQKNCSESFRIRRSCVGL